MADSPAIVARRTALARRIGAEMSVAARNKRAQMANATSLDSQGYAAGGNRARRLADAEFKQAKSGMVSRLKAGGI